VNGHPRLRSAEGGEPASAARWRRLQEQYPEADYTDGEGSCWGALRDDDNVMRARDLGALIDRLLAREAEEGRR
jgi:hypothetical protein